MALTIFYSWQSDLPNRTNRNFIERALEKAIGKVAEALEVVEAEREELVLDKDTKGIPGIPPIADVIFEKISKAAVFVPDLTFVGKSSNGRLIPNPNVLIEYGWALKVLGHSRIVPIMNAAYGEPTAETLPFDMRHLRHPSRIPSWTMWKTPIEYRSETRLQGIWPAHSDWFWNPDRS
jgi:hypothetical protein